MRTDAPAHAPDLAHGGRSKHRLQLKRCQRCQVADLRQEGGVAARFPFGCLGDVIGQLGQGFGGTHANAARNTDPLQDPGADAVAALDQATPQPGHINERLVD